LSWPGTYFAAPPPTALRWVEGEVGRGARVLRVRRLKGGTSSAVHGVHLRTRSGAALWLVLKRYVRPHVLRDEPWLIGNEANCLRLHAKTSVPAPHLVAVDVSGRECDVPALLMTRMPGRLVLRPKKLDDWLRKLAELLPPIHAIDLGAMPVRDWEIWDDIRDMRPPPWTRRPQSWQSLIEAARDPWPDYIPTFVHRDFQQYNVLWEGDRPSAVVDWMNASLGPRELDFNQLRYNLLGEFGFDVADRFLHIYRQVTGHDPNPFWEALNFASFGPVEKAEIDEYDAYVQALLVRLL
jgi:aminoglycoside phosphotransferase (APT) family kinase protein